MKRRWNLLITAAVLLAFAGVTAGYGDPAQAAQAPQAAEEKDRQAWEEKLRRRLAEVEVLLEEKLRHKAELESQLLAEKLAATGEQLQARLQGEELAPAVEEATLAAELAAAEAAAQGVAVVEMEGGGWLGVTIAEVTGEKVAELKLPAERGVLITDVEADSPAAKAGLQANDVITEYNGQRVEGAAQFRRMIRETPAGRAVQFTVWRDGRAQTLAATLASRREQLESRVRVSPRMREFHIPMPEMHAWSILTPTPTLGIRAEDVQGQLGEYFGAPDGEGVLVREVTSGSAAEKAGMKAGDVITHVDGERVRSLSDLRQQLRKTREEKTVPVIVVRRGQQVTLNVEIEQPRRRNTIQSGRRVRL